MKLRIWTDQIGSIRALATDTGTVIKYLEYEAFGNITLDTKSEWSFPLGFAGGLNDFYTGFVRFGFRDYDPQVGRFTVKDPIGDTGGDHDLWDYCVDDPITNQDNLGLISAKVKISGIHSGFNIAGMGILGLMFPNPLNEPEKIIVIRHEYDRIKNKETIKTTWENYRLWNLWQEDMRLRKKYKKHYEENDDFYKNYSPIK